MGTIFILIYFTVKSPKHLLIQLNNKTHGFQKRPSKFFKKTA